jgi:hypothetical protein
VREVTGRDVPVRDAPRRAGDPARLVADWLIRGAWAEPATRTYASSAMPGRSSSDCAALKQARST